MREDREISAEGGEDIFEEDRPLKLLRRMTRGGRVIPRGEEGMPSTEGEWDITCEFTQVGEGLVLSGLELKPGVFEAGVPAGGITARLLRQVKLGELVDDFRREHLGDMGALALLSGTRPAKSPYELPPAGNRPPPRAYPESFYQDVAVAYLRALDTDRRRPIVVMARSYKGYTANNLRDWVARSRDKGYLTPAERSRAGAQPTKKLLDALKARDGPKG